MGTACFAIFYLKRPKCKPLGNITLLYSNVPREKKNVRERKMDTGRKKPSSVQKNESEKAHFSPLVTK